MISNFHAGAVACCSIRHALPADAPTIIAGIDAVCAEGGAFETTRYVPTPAWEAVLYHPETVPDHLLVIAEHDRCFAGAGRLFPAPTDFLCRHVVDFGIFVAAGLRRRGIGTQLMTTMLAWATLKGFEKVTLSAFASNAAALTLFQRLGFVEEGRRRRQFKTGATYTDEVFLARFL